MSQPQMTLAIFDEAMEPPKRKIWGAPAIAQFLGCSVGKVRDLAKDQSSPVYTPGGRYFAYREELQAWLRTKRLP